MSKFRIEQYDAEFMRLCYKEGMERRVMLIAPGDLADLASVTQAALAEQNSRVMSEAACPVCVCIGVGWGGEEPNEICAAYVGVVREIIDAGRIEVCRHCGHDKACHSTQSTDQEGK